MSIKKLGLLHPLGRKKVEVQRVMNYSIKRFGETGGGG
jgi:hypothetical protein